MCCVCVVVACVVCGVYVWCAGCMFGGGVLCMCSGGVRGVRCVCVVVACVWCAVSILWVYIEKFRWTDKLN